MNNVLRTFLLIVLLLPSRDRTLNANTLVLACSLCGISFSISNQFPVPTQQAILALTRFHLEDWSWFTQIVNARLEVRFNPGSSE